VIPDRSYETYNTRAARLVAALNADPAEKSAELAGKLTRLIGTDSPRLISAIHQADAHVKLSNAEMVGPEARARLGPLMRHYASMPHPFTSCVRDNTKRFGADRAEKVCAVLKDLVVGNTRWRHGGGKAVPADPTLAATAPPADMTADPVTHADLDGWLDAAIARIAAELDSVEQVRMLEHWLSQQDDNAPAPQKP
jgi:hypothetical protein